MWVFLGSFLSLSFITSPLTLRHGRECIHNTESIPRIAINMVSFLVPGQLPPRKIAPRIIAPRTIGPWLISPRIIACPPGQLPPTIIAAEENCHPENPPPPENCPHHKIFPENICLHSSKFPQKSPTIEPRGTMHGLRVL